VPPWLHATVLMLLALRLAVPLAALASEAAWHALLADEFERSSAALEDTRSLLAQQGEALRPQTQPDDTSMLGRARAWLDEAGETLDVRQRLADFEATATAATRHIVNLAAVFVVQTVLLPLGFLALLVRLARRWAFAAGTGRDHGSGGALVE
jgi:hypothetical protein